MNKTFSERTGIKPARKALQVMGIDFELRNSLWNVFQMFYLKQIPRSEQYSQRHDLWLFARSVWFNLRKLPVDTVPSEEYNIDKAIRKYFMDSSWNEVYDLIDFAAREKVAGVNMETFISMVNHVLQRECAGWRFIDSHLAAISNETEVGEIEEALLVGSGVEKLAGVNAHLASAMQKLSDRGNPDYRGSIRESITALEALVRRITGEATLGKALANLDKKGLSLNERFKSGLEKFYAYTNDKDTGIRHALMEGSNVPDFYDAKYMLVTCSAFINFIVGKASKVDHLLDVAQEKE